MFDAAPVEQRALLGQPVIAGVVDDGIAELGGEEAGPVVEREAVAGLAAPDFGQRAELDEHRPRRRAPGGAPAQPVGGARGAESVSGQLQCHVAQQRRFARAGIAHDGQGSAIEHVGEADVDRTAQGVERVVGGHFEPASAQPKPDVYGVERQLAHPSAADAGHVQMRVPPFEACHVQRPVDGPRGGRR